MKQSLVFIFCLIATNFFAQSFSGLTLDNYSGVHGIIENPASIADSRHKFDLNLLSVSSFIDNDYASINFDSIDEFGEDNLTINDNNNVLAEIDILGPSLMMSLGSSQSIALSTRLRGAINVDEINGETITLLNDGFDYLESFKLDEDEANISANIWAEAGITYSRVVLNKKQHFVKAGVTAKYLQGIAGGSLNSQNLKIDYQTDGSSEAQLTTSGNLNYSYSNTLQAVIDNGLEDLNDLYSSDNTGYGFDAGFVYEWRPKYAKFNYKNEQGVLKSHRNKNKYLLKLSVSVNDIGKIAYKGAKNDIFNIDGTITEEDYDTSKSVEENLETLYTKTSSLPTMNMNLPTSLKVNLDFKATDVLFLNVRANRNLVKSNAIATRASNSFVFTPRFESKYVTTYFPMGVYEHSGFKAGFAVRLGFIHLGSSTLISNAFSTNTKAANVFVGAKIPISHGRYKGKVQDIEVFEVSESVEGLESE